VGVGVQNKESKGIMTFVIT